MSSSQRRSDVTRCFRREKTAIAQQQRGNYNYVLPVSILYKCQWKETSMIVLFFPTLLLYYCHRDTMCCVLHSLVI